MGFMGIMVLVLKYKTPQSYNISIKVTSFHKFKVFKVTRSLNVSIEVTSFKMFLKLQCMLVLK
jgi:hypothetical protein